MAPVSWRARLSIRMVSLGATVGIIVLMTVVTAWLVGNIASERLWRKESEVLVRLVRELADDMAQLMIERYSDILSARHLLEEELAEQHSPDQLRPGLEQLQQEFRYFSWIGFTDREGTVLAGTGKLLEGKSVAQRDWFVGAREKPFFGSAHPALLLANLIPNADGTPLYLVDIALPFHDAEGKFAGVLGSHLNWKMMEEIVQHGIDSLSSSTGVGVTILDVNNAILFDSHGWTGDMAPILTGLTPDSVTTRNWPEHGEVMVATATVPVKSRFDGLGWRLVIREPVDNALVGVRELQHQIVWSAAGVALVVLILGGLLIGRGVRPLEGLVHHMRAYSERESMPPDPPFTLIREFDHLHRTFQQMVRQVLANMGELASSRLEIIRSLARAGELRDNETGNHVIRMSQCCGHLAELAGLDVPTAMMIQIASQMHDLGKIGVPDHILLKPGRFNDEERAIINRHSEIGAMILGESQAPLMAMAHTIALTHHERWDGKGYPRGLAGEEIPLEGRITALCDVFDALLSHRPYKEGWPLEKAVALIREEAGKQFDPRLVEIFLAHVDDFVKIRETHLD